MAARLQAVTKLLFVTGSTIVWVIFSGIFLENKFGRGAIRVFQKLRGAELKLG